MNLIKGVCICLIILCDQSVHSNEPDEDNTSVQSSPRVIVLGSKSDPHNGFYNEIRKDYYTAKEETGVVIECQSDNPIIWKVNTFNNVLNEAGVSVEYNRSFKDFDREGTYTYVATLSIGVMSKGYIGTYKCHNVFDEHLYTSLHLFIGDHQDTDKINYLNAGTTVTVRMNKLDYDVTIPCPVSQPSEDFYLQYSTTFHTFKVEAKFVAHIGFIIENTNSQNLAGAYRCVLKGKESDDAKSVKINIELSEDYTIYPKEETIYTKEAVTVECASTQAVHMELEQIGRLRKHELIYKTDPDDPFPFSVTMIYKPSLGEKEGNIMCLRSNENLIHKWKYEVMHPGHGLSVSPDKSFIKCQSKIEGKIPKLSFEPCTLCNKETFSISEMNSSFSSCGDECIMVSAGELEKGAYKFNCTIDKFSTVTNVYLGLDKTLYIDWYDIPNNALIQIESEISKVGQTNFLSAKCRWTSIDLTQSAYWIAVLRNGSTIFIGERADVVNTEENCIRSSKLRYSGSLLKNVVEIQCALGHSYSTKWIRASAKIEYEFSNTEGEEPLHENDQEHSNKLENSEYSQDVYSHEILERLGSNSGLTMILATSIGYLAAKLFLSLIRKLNAPKRSVR